MKKKKLMIAALCASMGLSPIMSAYAAPGTDTGDIRQESELAEKVSAPVAAGEETEVPGDATEDTEQGSSLKDQETPADAETAEDTETPEDADTTEDPFEDEDTATEPSWKETPTGFMYETSAAENGKYYTDQDKWVQIGEAYYLFDENGYMRTGEVEAEDENGDICRYYLQEKTQDGDMPQNSSIGQRTSGWHAVMEDGTYMGKRYYDPKNNGAAVAEGWVDDGSSHYYIDQDTGYAVVDTELTIDGITYHFDEEGRLVGEENPNLKDGWNIEDGKWYLCKDGVKLMGWQQDPEDGKWYYLDSNGIRSGWIQDGDAYYFCNASGVKQTGWIQLGQTWYYLDETDGHRIYGWQNIDGKDYYFRPETGEMASGWVLDNGTYYYCSREGQKSYGWVLDEGKYYFMNKESGALTFGWFQDEGYWYLTDASGAMRVGWVESGGHKYFLNASGHMVTGFQQIGNYKYYFSEDGIMQTGWVKIDGAYRYFRGDGIMATGWQQVGDNVYYLQEDGTRLADGWHRFGEDRYYFDDRGVNYRNGWYYIDGYKYYFQADGKLLQDLDTLIGQQSSYVLKVDRTACIVTVYAKDGDNGYIIPVKEMICSVGLPETPTSAGTFYTSAKFRVKELIGPSWGKFATRVYNGVYFHSVACLDPNNVTFSLPAAEFNKLGTPASHGCIRLCVRDARWIYENCAIGTQVTIGDNYFQPYDRPYMQKIPLDWFWDPTDVEALR